MPLSDFRVVETWVENDLLNLPSQETDYYEYKSSQILSKGKWTPLQQEICNAACAFWNIGGGVFIAGVDNKGQIDGGIPSTVGTQPIRAWVDQVIHAVQPVGPYAVGVIQPSGPSSPIQPDKVVLVISFGESFNVPHMSSDKRHYARLGVHTEPAPYYLVEAIRARRGLREPYLRAIIRFHERKPDIIELVILNMSDGAALDVTITLYPLPKLFDTVKDNFPLKIPILDRQFPFSMEIGMFPGIGQGFDSPMRLDLAYVDYIGRQFQQSQTIEIKREINQVSFVAETKGEKTLEEISKQIKRLNEIIEVLAKKLTKPDTPQN